MDPSSASHQYDAIAADYARANVDELAQKPFDRGILHSFARSVRDARGTTVLDVGCGPGTAAAELRAAGLSVIGLDASGAMVEHARRRTPDASFVVADLAALPVRENAVDAVCAWYSIVHTPAEQLAAPVTEFRRVLSADGWLLLAFQTAAPTLELRTAYGRAVHLDFVRHDVDAVQTTLMDSGFVLHRDATRTANKELGETAAQAFVVARANDHLRV